MTEQIRVRSGVTFYELSNLESTRQTVIDKLTATILAQAHQGLVLASLEDNVYSIFDLLFEAGDSKGMNSRRAAEKAEELLNSRMRNRS